jgi:hypothetical protein
MRIELLILLCFFKVFLDLFFNMLDYFRLALNFNRLVLHLYVAICSIRGLRVSNNLSGASILVVLLNDIFVPFDMSRVRVFVLL